MRYAVMGLLTGLVGLVLAGLAGDTVTRLHRVSDFEGARAYLVVFLLAPAGALLGVIVAVLCARRVVPGQLSSLVVQEAWALAITAGIVGAAFGLAWLTAERPLAIDGRDVILELEIRVPAHLVGAEGEGGIRVSLYAGSKDNASVDLDRDAVRREAQHLVFPGRARLRSRAARRSLLVGLSPTPAQVVDLPLEASPTAPSAAWSPWLAARADARLAPVAPADAVEVRYRVAVDGGPQP